MPQILRAVNQVKEFEDGLSSQVLQLSIIRQQAYEYTAFRADESVVDTILGYGS
jgi:hypothetical protein